VLTGQEMQLGAASRSPTRHGCCSRYVDGIMIRILEHDTLLELAANATVPVINGLTKTSHPCQVMADVLTFEAAQGPDPRPHGGLVGRREQRARVLDPKRPGGSTQGSMWRLRAKSIRIPGF
jgi:hypothetical protein